MQIPPLGWGCVSGWRPVLPGNIQCSFHAKLARSILRAGIYCFAELAESGIQLWNTLLLPEFHPEYAALWSGSVMTSADNADLYFNL